MHKRVFKRNDNKELLDFTYITQGIRAVSIIEIPEILLELLGR